MPAIAFNRLIGPVPLDVFMSEKHEHTLGITSDPIETGAEVNDHAYLKPMRLTLRIGSKNAAETFNALKQFQASRVPFTIVSGLFQYTNMLIASLQAERDEAYSRVLSGTVDLQEVIIVDTAYAGVGTDDQAGKSGEAGGKKSLRAAAPSPNKTKPGDGLTSDRVSGTVQRGDSPTTTVTPTEPANQTLLKGIFG